jgi:hypothetical protein
LCCMHMHAGGAVSFRSCKRLEALPGGADFVRVREVYYAEIIRTYQIENMRRSTLKLQSRGCEVLLMFRASGSRESKCILRVCPTVTSLMLIHSGYLLRNVPWGTQRMAFPARPRRRWRLDVVFSRAA